MLADEVLTPDSSRFWPADEWQPGRTQPSYDKQIVRNWLTSAESGWDRASGEAPPPLPPEVVELTRARYVEAYERLTGATLLMAGPDGRPSPSTSRRPSPTSTPTSSTREPPRVAVQPAPGRRTCGGDGGVGTTWLDVTAVGAKPRMTTTVAEPGVAWAETGTWRGIAADLRLDFHPLAAGTRVVATFELRTPRALAPGGRASCGGSRPSAIRGDLERAARQVGSSA